MHGGRAEVPYVGLFVTGQQSEAAHFVPLPLANLCPGHISDVIHVKKQKRAAAGFLKRGFCAREAVLAEAIVINPALEVYIGVAKSRYVLVPPPSGCSV